MANDHLGRTWAHSSGHTVAVRVGAESHGCPRRGLGWRGATVYLLAAAPLAAALLSSVASRHCASALACVGAAWLRKSATGTWRPTAEASGEFGRAPERRRRLSRRHLRGGGFWPWSQGAAMSKRVDFWSGGWARGRLQARARGLCCGTSAHRVMQPSPSAGTEKPRLCTTECAHLVGMSWGWWLGLGCGVGSRI